MAGGAVVLTGMLVGVIRSDLGFLAAGVSLLLGGIVAWGSDSRTAKEVTKALAVAEKTLIHVCHLIRNVPICVEPVKCATQEQGGARNALSTYTSANTRRVSPCHQVTRHALLPARTHGTSCVG